VNAPVLRQRGVSSNATEFGGSFPFRIDLHRSVRVAERVERRRRFVGRSCDERMPSRSGANLQHHSRPERHHGWYGLMADPRMVEQDSARTANIQVSIKKPNGDELFEVECGMNTLNQLVSLAHIRPGPTITDDDATYLRGAGYCCEP
jgi:hypothetical protein